VSETEICAKMYVLQFGDVEIVKRGRTDKIARQINGLRVSRQDGCLAWDERVKACSPCHQRNTNLWIDRLENDGMIGVRSMSWDISDEGVVELIGVTGWTRKSDG